MPDSLRHALSALMTKLQDWLDYGVSMLPNFVLAALVVTLAGFASRKIAELICRGLKRVLDNEALVNLVSTLTRVVVVGLGSFAALSLLHLEKTVTSLLAGLGVVGLALGFAFQDIAANFMSGAFLAVRGPFEAGDTIVVDGETGIVTSIELRRTTLRTFDGLTIIIPNRQVFQAKVINYTRTHERRVAIPVGVAYGDDLERTREVVLDALAELEQRDDARELELIFTGFGDSAIDFEVRFWLDCASQALYLEARSEAIIRIKRAMDEAGLTIPFPIRTLDFGAAEVGGERLDAMRLQVVEPR